MQHPLFLLRPAIDRGCTRRQSIHLSIHPIPWPVASVSYPLLFDCLVSDADRIPCFKQIPPRRIKQCRTHFKCRLNRHSSSNNNPSSSSSSSASLSAFPHPSFSDTADADAATEPPTVAAAAPTCPSLSGFHTLQVQERQPHLRR